MNDLIVGIGLVLVIEGLVWAAFPSFAFRALEAMRDAPETALRSAGAIAVAAGVLIVWLIRG